MSHRSVLRTWATSISTLSLLAAVGIFLAACGGEGGGSGSEGTGGAGGELVDPGGTPIEGDGETDFVSDMSANSGSSYAPTAGVDDAAGTGGTTSAEVDGGANSPERAISEADIIKVEGDTLYALSRYSGLTIIDLANPADLQVLGTYRSTAMPFEMYLESGTAYIMFNDYYHREWDEEAGYYVWQSTSRMLALDVSTQSGRHHLRRHPPGQLLLAVRRDGQHSRELVRRFRSQRVQPGRPGTVRVA
jgi:hypothetical protein